MPPALTLATDMPLDVSTRAESHIPEKNLRVPRFYTKRLHESCKSFVVHQGRKDYQETIRVLLKIPPWRKSFRGTLHRPIEFIAQPPWPNLRSPRHHRRGSRSGARQPENPPDELGSFH